MHAARKKTTALGKAALPQLVGTIHDSASLEVARRPRLDPQGPDVLEVRLDRIVPPDAAWEAILRRRVVLTARHPAEGGPKGLAAAERRRLLHEHRPLADAVDLELRSFPGCAALAEEAKAGGAELIVSFHDFGDTPPVAKLREVAARAAAVGADLVKVATRTDTPAALARLLTFAAEPQAVPLAVMGMGRFGRISRLLLAQAGTALVYCALAGANAPGQWPVGEFRRALRGLQEA